MCVIENAFFSIVIAYLPQTSPNVSPRLQEGSHHEDVKTRGGISLFSRPRKHDKFAITFSSENCLNIKKVQLKHKFTCLYFTTWKIHALSKESFCTHRYKRILARRNCALSMRRPFLRRPCLQSPALWPGLPVTGLPNPSACSQRPLIMTTSPLIWLQQDLSPYGWGVVFDAAGMKHTSVEVRLLPGPHWCGRTLHCTKVRFLSGLVYILRAWYTYSQTWKGAARAFSWRAQVGIQCFTCVRSILLSKCASGYAHWIVFACVKIPFSRAIDIDFGLAVKSKWRIYFWNRRSYFSASKHAYCQGFWKHEDSK